MNAIDLEVIYQSTLQIARELTVNMLRTGYSTIIKESQDFTFAIFDGEGRMVAQGIPQPLHIGPLAAQVKEIIRRYRGKIEQHGIRLASVGLKDVILPGEMKDILNSRVKHRQPFRPFGDPDVQGGDHHGDEVAHRA